MRESMSCVSRTPFALLFKITDDTNVPVRYGFKEDPDIAELPEYGQASLDGDNYW